LENPKELKKGRDYAFYEQWLGKGLLLSDGEIWREHRKALTPTFHFSMLDQYCAVFNRQAKA
jgi:cytochrome P450